MSSIRCDQKMDKPTKKSYHKLKEIYLVQRPIRNAIFSHLSLDDLLKLRTTNSEVKQICDLYIQRNIKMKIELNNNNCEDILSSSLNFEFCEVHFNNIEIKFVEPLKRIIKNCNQLIFENIDLSVNIGEIMDCCDNLKMVLFNYHPRMLTPNITLQHPFPNVNVASFQYNSNESIK